MNILMTYAHDFENETFTHDEDNLCKKIVKIAKENINKFPFDAQMQAAVLREDAAYILKNWFQFTDGAEWMAVDIVGYARADYGKAG